MARAKHKLLIEVLRYAVSGFILLLGIAGFFVLLFLKPKPATSDDGDNEVTVVQTARVVAHNRGVTIEVSGLVVPFREIEIPAEVGGRIIHKNPVCRAGRYVEKDAPLFEIEKQDYEIAREEASGALLELQSEKRSTEALLSIAKKTYEVEKRDYQRETGLRGVVSRADLDQAERELLAAENSVVTLENQLALNTAREKRLDAALSRANLDLQRANVHSPVSGVIVKEMVEQDMFVQRGTTMLVVEDTSKAEIKCNLKKEDLQWLWLTPRAESAEPMDHAAADYEIPRAAADVYFDLAGIQYQWSGRLDRYDGIGLDTQTRTIPCRVVVDDPRAVRRVGEQDVSGATGPPALLRGMYVKIAVQAAPSVLLWRVPQEAVRPGKIIWLVRDGKLVKQTVRIAQSLADGVVVHVSKGELAATDRVVTSPLAYPREGLKVKEAGADEEPKDELGEAAP